MLGTTRPALRRQPYWRLLVIYHDCAALFNTGVAALSDTPFIKFYPSDFLAGTSGLSPAERGVYITILCLIYEANGKIVRDDARLSRRCGMPKAAFLRTIQALIDQGKLSEVDGMLSNKRAESAIMDRQNRVQNATHAANSKWSAQKQKVEQNQPRLYAVAMPEQCVEDASQNQNQNIKERDTNVSLKKRIETEDGFDDFWSIVPRRVGKAHAKKAWTGALRKASSQTIIEAMSKYARQRQGQDPQYTAHPATWLNGERWLDEVESGWGNALDDL